MVAYIRNDVDGSLTSATIV